MSELFERLREKRNISERFLNPKYEECFDPFLLPDMRKAIERIKKAIESQERILIYGDYDVDGVTASTLMNDALKMAGANVVKIMLPNRFLDGYGMSKKVVQRAKDEKIGLVVTVDCGSRNEEIIDELFENGIETIVTDHHECGENIPDKAVAVVNPKRKDFQGDESLRDLAGVGVAFEVARGLVREGMIQDGQEKWFLDLVVIGTICDSMKMSEENRRFCYFGMKVLEKTRRKGLRELIRMTGVKQMNSDGIGFQIGPRLNAAGRMDSAERALNLLLAENGAEAARLAGELNELNSERRVQQVHAVDEINEVGVGNEKVIVQSGKWHEGILGIIAGKLTEEYKRPSFVFTEVEGVFKGSGRSFGEFNLAEALKECEDVILSGGGHAEACGVKIALDKIEDFKTKINDFYQSLNLIDQERFLEKQEDLVISEFRQVGLDFVDEIKKLEPFGNGNEEPAFLLKNVLLTDVRKMGTREEHLRLQVSDKNGKEIKLVAFFAPEEWLRACRGQRGDILVTLTDNEWNGTRSVEGRILKMRLVEEEVF